MKTLLAALFGLLAALPPVAGAPDDGLYRVAEDGSLSRAEVRILEAAVDSSENANRSFRAWARLPFDRAVADFSVRFVLRAGGEDWPQCGSGASGEEWCSLDFAVTGRAAAEAAATCLRAPLRLRRHPGHRLLVEFVPGKETWGAGEEVTVVLRLANVGEEAVTFRQGGRNRAERDNQYVFSARLGGKQVEDVGTSGHFGGLSVRRALAPGEAFEAEVPLAKWFAFSSPGVYEIHGSYYLEFSDPADEDGWPILWEDYASADFLVTVRAADGAGEGR